MWLNDHGNRLTFRHEGRHGMFCFQCEQTAKGTGCTARGVCGKDAETAALQDALVQVTKGISMYAHRARALAASDRELDVFVIEALFTTVTNVNFDPERIADLIRRGVEVRDRARRLYEDACATAKREPETRPTSSGMWQSWQRTPASPHAEPCHSR